MPNDIRTEHSFDIILEKSKLTGSKLTKVCLSSFQCTPTRITDLVRNVSDEKIYRYRTDTFVYVFVFIKLVCAIYLMNTPFFTFVLQ